MEIFSRILFHGTVFGLESEILRKMHRRIVKNFLYVLILLELMDNQLSGYDVISFIHKHFNVLLSSGAVYSCLYFMEREGLIRSERVRRKRVYKLTEKGKQTVRTLLKMKDKILGLVVNLFIGK
jgi:DNA-binding PadR family transcriptional regulator